MMKKFRLLLCMILCVFAITGCGKEEETPIITEADAQMITETVFNMVKTLVDAEEEGVYYDLEYFPYNVQMKAVDSFERALRDMGEIGEISSYEVDLSAEEAVVTAKVKGTDKDANIEVMLELEVPSTVNVTSVALNVEYTFGEKMANAGMNTLLGMGTVFAVLILLIALIWFMGVVVKAIEGGNKKETKKTAAKEAAIDNTIAQIAEKEEAGEELVSDLELVAVIAAAIAASEGAASTDGFVVRSIRKSNAKKWQNA